MQLAPRALVAGFVRRTWLTALVTIVVCATFAARAVAALIEASYFAPAVHGAAPPPVMRVATKARARPNGSDFVARNMCNLTNFR